jgi:hypothetical protein
MCWCPITNLDYADEAYEWNMGVTRTDLDNDMQALSDGMAEAFAQYINELGLQDSDGNVLTLTESSDGIYQAGSYYEYVKAEVERSLNNFLADTTFPYTAGSEKTGGMNRGNGMGRGGARNGQFPDGELKDGINRDLEEITQTDNATYETSQDFIDSLNQDTACVSYDSETNTATITSVADFVKVCKKASKSVGAFEG